LTEPIHVTVDSRLRIDVRGVSDPEIERLKARFDQKVRKTAGCWLWLGAPDRDGYGNFRLGGRGSKMVKASWAAWLIAKGELPSSPVLMHTCDNPQCVNPEHLVPGTQAQNIADRQAKGRAARGERIGISKLTRARVEAIRQLYGVDGTSAANLASLFEVSKTLVAKIVRREVWA
jgi:hypothetical protein